MITYEDIIFVIVTIGIFFQGFYIGRRQITRFVIVSLILLLSFTVSIMKNGIYTYSGAILDVNIYDALIATIYVSFWWGFGFMISHFILITEKDIGKIKIKRYNDIER